MTAPDTGHSAINAALARMREADAYVTEVDEELITLLERINDHAPYWTEPYAAGYVLILEAAVRLSTAIVASCQAQSSEPDSCHTVEVDGETIRVRGEGEMDQTSRSALANVVRAAKRRMEAEKATERAEIERQVRAKIAEELRADAAAHRRVLERHPTRLDISLRAEALETAAKRITRRTTRGNLQAETNVPEGLSFTGWYAEERAEIEHQVRAKVAEEAREAADRMAPCRPAMSADVAALRWFADRIARGAR